MLLKISPSQPNAILNTIVVSRLWTPDELFEVLGGSWRMTCLDVLNRGSRFAAIWNRHRIASISIRDGKGTPKNLCDKDFAELSGEFSGAICLKDPVLLGSAE